MERTTARGGARLLNPPIKITPGRLQRTIEKHGVGGSAKYAGKSKFNPAESIEDLIRAGTQRPMVPQPNGNFARTFDVGRQIGTSMHTGQPTSMMTIITNAMYELVTAFPGVP